MLMRRLAVPILLLIVFAAFGGRACASHGLQPDLSLHSDVPGAPDTPDTPDVPNSPSATTDDLVFIHHSVGNQWLNRQLNPSLNDALLAKDYIDERNDIYYDVEVPPDPGRPDSLAIDGKDPGDHTDMEHWVRWFNDYRQGVKAHGTADGYNRIIMFKSCFPASNVSADGTEPNYKAVYRHPDGPGHTYSYSGSTYKPLEDIFAENPDVLFIPVTAPPRHYASTDATTDAEGARARAFNNWLKNEWLPSYNAAHPGLHNVAVFDWFDILAYPDDHPQHPNRLRQEYGGESGDSHPNSAADVYSTQVFATDPGNFLDGAWGWYTFVGNEQVFLPLVVHGS